MHAAGYRTACLTNNVVVGRRAAARPEVAAVMARFDVVVESRKIGVRKPEPRFYEIACELLDVEPAECVFLDDLGINLKPAKAMGMTTIKVGDPAGHRRADRPPRPLTGAPGACQHFSERERASRSPSR